MFIDSAFAQTAAPAGGDSLITMLAPMAIVFAIFYFLVIRPQQKKIKEHRAKLDAVRRGDKVVTGGGIIGKVTHVRDDEAELEIAPNVRIRVVKATLADVTEKTAPAGNAETK